ncbi:MAG TPA: hypothetical protein VMR51_02360 [Patescibacteria group bacterium]|nr:hypothetical protein [Patescibacteria group bacterium]
MFLIVAVLIVLCFAAVLLFGAPYLPTLKQQQQTALSLLNLKAGQTLLDLGCGDGRILLAAAKEGIYGVGYELNPLLFLVAKVVTWRYRKLVKIYLADFWQIDWPNIDGIYVFLLKKYMVKLNNKIVQINCKNIKVVSYAFEIPDKKIIKKLGAMYLYYY